MSNPPDQRPPDDRPQSGDESPAAAAAVTVACDACKTECVLTPVSGPTLLRRTLPRGWRPRRIDGRVYILCDICGNLRQFVGGLSPYLQELLRLPPNVEIEMPEYTELPDAWLNRVGNVISRK